MQPSNRPNINDYRLKRHVCFVMKIDEEKLICNEIRGNLFLLFSTNEGESWKRVLERTFVLNALIRKEEKNQ